MIVVSNLVYFFQFYILSKKLALFKVFSMTSTCLNVQQGNLWIRLLTTFFRKMKYAFLYTFL